MKRFTLKNLFFNRSDQPDQTKERRRKPRPIDGYDLTVLVVDDSRTVIAAFKKVLTQAGFNVISAANGEEDSKRTNREGSSRSYRRRGRRPRRSGLVRRRGSEDRRKGAWKGDRLPVL